MNNIAFIFDGQGNKFNNFGKDFYEQNKEFRQFIDRYKEIFDIQKEVYDKAEDDINTDIFQPAAFLVEMGIVELLNRNGIYASSSAGSSLGEYSALANAKYLKIEDGISILQKRGSLMKNELSKIDSQMNAIMFLDNEIVEKIAQENNCEISNENSYGQVVISGLSEEVEKASEECIKNGAKRVIKLDSQGAFHSKYLKGIEKEFSEFLNQYRFERNENSETRMYFNYTGKKEEINELSNEEINENIHDLLVKQLYSKVKFMQIIENMLDDEIDTFYEIGAGGNLVFHIKNIASKKGKKVKIYKINNYEDYIGVI